VDGFNLYYGSLKRTPHKWLNLDQLFGRLFPGFDIERIKYFTARVKQQSSDPSQPVRQQMYLRALKTVPKIQIVFGHFLSHVVRMPMADCGPGGQEFVRVIKAEEKGSDVNLAVHLLHDAHMGQLDAAVVVSNDSDLREAVRIVTTELNVPVFVVYPGRRSSRALVEFATGVRAIRRGLLATSQFPPRLRDRAGEFGKPASW